jgi:bifunctional non-homologous end joining protein LigD
LSLDKKGPMPLFIPPMLCTLIDRPFSHPEWIFEIKWDGYRALAFIDRREVTLKSRNNVLWNTHFSEIVTHLKKIKDSVILDGEIVVLDPKGKSQFQLLQNYYKERKGILVYCVFDLLYHNGKDLRHLPLFQRKKMLELLLTKASLPFVHYSSHVEEKGELFFKKAAQANLEGIIGKNRHSTYQSKRSRDWVKIKTKMRQEVIIGGFTKPRGSRSHFGALLVGVYNKKNQLKYCGRVGGGFSETLLKDVYQKLIPLKQKNCPFQDFVGSSANITWVKPRLVAEVAFTEWTSDRRLRHSVFQGLRIDKPPREIRRETILLPLQRALKKRF